MSDKEKKITTGAEALTAISEERKAKAIERVLCLLRNTVAEIDSRKGWIEARQAQIAKLELMQAEIVKLFDAGELTDSKAKRFSFHLNAFARAGAGPHVSRGDVPDWVKAKMAERYGNPCEDDND